MPNFFEVVNALLVDRFLMQAAPARLLTDVIFVNCDRSSAACMLMQVGEAEGPRRDESRSTR